MTAAREVQVTFDCADPAALSGFWAEVMGYRLDPPPPGFDSWIDALTAWGVPESEHNSRSAVSDPAGAGPRLFFQRVPDGNRSAVLTYSHDRDTAIPRRQARRYLRPTLAAS